MDVIARALLDAARQHLRDFGIDLHTAAEEWLPAHGTGARWEGVVTLTRQGSEQRYSATVQEEMTLSSVAHAPARERPHPLLVIGRRIHSRSAAAFRDAGIQYVDTLGNAFLAFGGVLVDVQGRADHPVYVREAPMAAQASVDLFSPRRAQVILALLAWPELSRSTVRHIATAAGVSVGQAHKALVLLGDAGYLAPQGGLDRAGELLDFWASAYPRSLSPQLELARYHGDASKPVRPVEPDQRLYFSGESAVGVGISRATTMTVYVDALDPMFPVVNRWSSSPGREPNILIRRRFWTDPHPPADAEAQNAPWPLVYADLVATGDARLAEVAREWRGDRA